MAPLIFREKLFKQTEPLLLERLRSHFNDRTTPLLLNGISAIDPWFKEASGLKHPLREVFSHILKDEFSIIEIDETPVITRLSLNEWEAAINSGKNFLRDLAHERVSEEYAHIQVSALFCGAGEELRDDLWSIVRPFAMWAVRPDGVRILVGYGRSAETVVTAVLESAGQPLHYREIYRRSKLISDRDHEERALHHAARNVAVLYNRGTYGLLSQCPLTPNELALIQAEVEDIAAGADPAKQWHTSELLDELLERGFDFDGQINKYIINIALRNSKTFANLRRMIWGYRDSWQASAASRLDMRQAVMALLEDARRPLSTLEIRDRLEGDRGVNNHFQIHPQGNLIRMGSGLWGLANRDIHVSDPEKLLDQLVAHLNATQEGVHSSEVAKVLGDIDEVDAQALLGIIKQQGMRRDRGQYVYLSAWEGSRRVWPGEAIEKVLDSHSEGMLFEQILLEVNQITRREMNGIYISHLLCTMEGAIYDPDTQTWKRESVSDDDLEFIEEEKLASD